MLTISAVRIFVLMVDRELNILFASEDMSDQLGPLQVCWVGGTMMHYEKCCMCVCVCVCMRACMCVSQLFVSVWCSVKSCHSAPLPW